MNVTGKSHGSPEMSLTSVMTGEIFRRKRYETEGAKEYRKANMRIQMGGWMDDLRLYVLFNSISVISGQWADGNERRCAMEFRLRLRRFCLEQGSTSGPLDK